MRPVRLPGEQLEIGVASDFDGFASHLEMLADAESPCEKSITHGDFGRFSVSYGAVVESEKSEKGPCPIHSVTEAEAGGFDRL
jgi:hypothetical protein